MSCLKFEHDNENGLFERCNLIVNIKILESKKVNNMFAMFLGCDSLKKIDFWNIDTSEVTNMSFMFGSCTLLNNIDFGNIDTRKVANMSYMFYDCNALTNLVLNFNMTYITTSTSIPINLFFS